jgi:hypothetical protein
MDHEESTWITEADSRGSALRCTGPLRALHRRYHVPRRGHLRAVVHVRLAEVRTVSMGATHDPAGLSMVETSVDTVGSRF